MRRVLILAASAAAIAGGAMLAPAANAAPPDHYTVANNTSPAGCANHADFSTIQGAVDAAASGATISVCPGTYQEYVTVPPGKDNLSIKGMGGNPAAKNSSAPVILYPTSPNSDASAFDPNALVTVNGATGVNVQGMTVSGPFTDTGCEAGPTVHYGVFVIGGGSAQLQQDYVTKIEPTESALMGCQDGVAVRAGSQGLSQAGSVTVQNSLIDQYEKGGVVVDGAGSTGQVQNNTITGVGPTQAIAQNGVQVSRNAMGAVQNNMVSGNEYTGTDTYGDGILLFQAGDGVSVLNNKLTDNDIAVDVESGSNNSVQNNQTSTSSSNIFAAGIYVYDQSSSRFTNNKTAGGTEGIESNRVTSTTFQNNNVTNASDVGVYNDSTSTNNTYQNNKASGSGTYDCQDQSVGAGTAGTANTWMNDKGATSSPPGICRK